MEASYTVIYVAADGSDSNPGTESEPVGTVGEAVARARASNAGEKRIVIRGGCYYDVGLVLTAEDSDLTIEAYADECPILYGGIPVTAWERDGELLTARLECSDDIRAIEVNGEHRPRARLPASGTFHHGNRFEVQWISSLAGGWERKPLEEELLLLKVSPSDIGPWLDTNNAELTIYHEWDESLVQAKSYDSAAGTLEFANRPGHPPGAFADRNPNANRYVVWNVKEGMTRPGQWMVDRAGGRLVYWPLPSEMERPEALHAVIPSRERILQLDQGAEGIRIIGLTFACSAAPLVSGNFGSVDVSAAIVGHAVRNITFERVTVRHTGGWACRFTGEQIRLDGCHIHHTGAGGIHYKGEGVVLVNSRLHDVGLVYQSAVAVMGGGRGNAVIHNDIYHTPYSGIINVGSYSEIKDNLFHQVMTFMKDGAAVYCSGANGVTISGNAVFADPEMITRSYAYYLDELCESCSVEYNLAVNTQLPVLSHMTRNCRYYNNVFLDKGRQAISAANSFGLAFERNILAAEGIDFFSPRGNPEGLPSEYDFSSHMKPYSSADGIVSMRNNIMFSQSGRIVWNEYLQYKVIRQFDVEQADGVLFADPLFADFSGGDFMFQAESPAWAAEIKPLFFAEAGCSGRFPELMSASGYWVLG